jgi:hypothetical protein
LAKSILEKRVLLVPTGIVPDEGNNARVVCPRGEVETRVWAQLVYYFCNLIGLPQEFHFNDEFYGRDKKVGSWLFLAKGWEVLLILEVGKHGGQKKVKEVLDMVFVVDVPLPGLSPPGSSLFVPRPAAKACGDALEKLNDILDSDATGDDHRSWAANP